MLFISRKSAWRVAERMVRRGVIERFRVEARYRREADGSAERGFVIVAWRCGAAINV